MRYYEALFKQLEDANKIKVNQNNNYEITLTVDEIPHTALVLTDLDLVREDTELYQAYKNFIRKVNEYNIIDEKVMNDYICELDDICINNDKENFKDFCKDMSALTYLVLDSLTYLLCAPTKETIVNEI